MDRAHYLRFARALALTVVVPGCASALGCTTTPTPAPSLLAEADAHAAPGDASTHTADDADVDAGLPFSSGPIVPPELPVGFA